MPRKKKTLAQKFAENQTQEYIAKMSGDLAGRAKAVEKLSQLMTEHSEMRQAGELTANEEIEVSIACDLQKLYEALRMAYSAFCMQGVAFAQKALRYTEEILDAERRHMMICAQPVSVLIDEAGGYADLRGAAIPCELVDLAECDPEEDPQGFIEAIRQNDTAVRAQVLGLLDYKKGLLNGEDEGMLRKFAATSADMEENAYENLFELHANLDKELTQAYENIQAAAQYAGKYLFAAACLEAFTKVKGLQDIIAPPHMRDMLEDTAIAAYNNKVATISEKQLLRMSKPTEGADKPQIAGQKYVRGLLEQAAKTWLKPIEKDLSIDPQEVKKITRKLEMEDLVTSSILLMVVDEMREGGGK